jgi:starvation-inducible DNA-binding protein
MQENDLYNYSKEGLAQKLAEYLSATVVAQYMAHGYHWNVKGPEFTQFHDFFGEIYESWTGPEDRIAEYIRILGFDAPFALDQFMAMSCVIAKPSAGDPMEMSANLYEANMQILNLIEDVFAIATAINNQAIANFAAERQDVHSKWSWQIGTTIGADTMQIQTMNLGKSKAEVPLEVMFTNVTEPQPTQASVREALTAAGHLVPEENDLAEALVEIASKYGKFNEDQTGIWAGYYPASENPYAAMGVKCSNCVLYRGGENCAIIALPVEPEGYCRFAVLPDGTVDPSKAPKSELKKVISFPEPVQSELSAKAEKAGTSVDQLKVVYRRGAADFSATPGQTRSSWAMSRVDAFVALLQDGTPRNPEYVQDNDLLPSGHRRAASAKVNPLTASATIKKELIVELKDAEEYKTPEEAIYAITEFSGLGYEALPAFRAAWRRGVADSQKPFNRAAALAIRLYDSVDADLLPKK